MKILRTAEMVSIGFHSRECTEKCQPVKISLIVRHFEHSLYIKIYMHFCIHIEHKYSIFLRKKKFWSEVVEEKRTHILFEMLFLYKPYGF